MEESFPVYLDYNATTPLDPEVIQVIFNSLKNDWGNPSSAHSLGLCARNAIERSRKQVAGMINAKESGEEIVFMSGGTEANNVALQSAISTFTAILNTNEILKPHVITSNVEHDSIKKFLEMQETLGKIGNFYTNNEKRYGINAFNFQIYHTHKLIK
jgi:selenocysteine lyase